MHASSAVTPTPIGSAPGATSYREPERQRTESAGRIRSIDIVRGAVMVLMALDHVRVFAGVPAGGPTPALFFTRWVTNFCAPAFFFLAGTGAYLYSQRIGDRRAVARWLLTRGLWLVLLELTVLRFAWTFNFDYAHYTLAGVIWALGWCMVLMAGLVFLPLRAIAAIGVAIIALHNAVMPALASVVPSMSSENGSWFWRVLYFGGPVQLSGADGAVLFVLYSLIPWVGVMAAGYAYGRVTQMEPARRDRFNRMLGAALVVAFLLLRATDVYGDQRPWHAGNAAAPALLRFLNASKYPASLSFLLMTLGPVFLVLPLLERVRGRFWKPLEVFGRVPLFYYLLHIPLIHVVAVIVSGVRHDGGMGWLRGNHPAFVGPPPDGYTWSLPLLYAVTVVVVALLYPACAWYARLRAQRPDSWLRYL
jgi:uncharacterized membrane protein